MVGTDMNSIFGEGCKVSYSVFWEFLKTNIL